MKILLLNDNPVVRKLVALSAQKTRDDLNVIWSVEEAEGDAYDLLIVDDAHYSDEAMGALRGKIQYKLSLLMATRGNAIPAGFDKVINKPFLPTDLVDLFSQIAKDLVPSVQEAVELQTEETKKAIVLDDALEDDKKEKGFDITHLDDDLSLDNDLSLDDFDIEDEEDAFEAKTNVLDHEEVQELQGLLDDTDGFDLEDEDVLGSLDEDVLQAFEAKSPEGEEEHDLDDAMDEFDFDEERLSLDDEPVKPIEEDLDEDDLLGSLDDLAGMDEEEAAEPQVAEIVDEIDDLDALLLEGLEDLDEDEENLSQEIADDPLSDDEFGELEQQIQEAVGELGIEDLEQDLDGVDMEDIGDFEGFGDLDGLSERDIKLAIGEEVEEAEEEEPEVRIGHGSHASLDAEALSEAMGESSVPELDDELEDIDLEMPVAVKPTEDHHATPAEGMDALQALLKALSNEEVAKTLKGLSINININFGNEK